MEDQRGTETETMEVQSEATGEVIPSHNPLYPSPIQTFTFPQRQPPSTPSNTVAPRLRQEEVTATHTWSSETPEKPQPKRPRGRPRQYDVTDVIDLVACHHFKVSSTEAGELTDYFRGTKKDASKQTVERAAVEALLSFRFELAKKLARSKDLLFTIDGAGYKRGRDFIALKFGGVEDGQYWICTVGWIEKAGDGSARRYLSEFEKVLKNFNECQKKLNIHETQIYEFVSCTYDNTNLNTGEKGVLGVLVEERRQEEWKRANKEGKLPPLVTVGCLDHICDMASKQFTHHLKASASEQARKVTNLLKQIALMTTTHRREMENFWKGFKCELKMEAHSSFRYASIDEIARCLYSQFPLFVLWYIHAWSQLSPSSKEGLRLLADPEIQQLIKVRAIIADALLMTTMREAKQKTAREHVAAIRKYQDTIAEALQSPLSFVKSHKYSGKYAGVRERKEVNQFLQKYRSDRSEFEKKMDALQKSQNIPEKAIQVLKNLYTECAVLRTASQLDADPPGSKEIYDDLPTSAAPTVSAFLEKISAALSTHTKKTIKQISELDEDIRIEATNRTTERVIGQGENIISKGNAHMRGILVEARLIIQESEVDDIKSAVLQYSPQFNLHTEARKVLDGQPTRSELNEEEARTKRQKIDTADKKLSQGEYAMKQILSAFFLAINRLEGNRTSVTIEILRDYLIEKGGLASVQGLEKLKDYMEATVPYLLNFLASFLSSPTTESAPPIAVPSQVSQVQVFPVPVFSPPSFQIPTSDLVLYQDRSFPVEASSPLSLPAPSLPFLFTQEIPPTTQYKNPTTNLNFSNKMNVPPEQVSYYGGHKEYLNTLLDNVQQGVPVLPVQYASLAQMFTPVGVTGASNPIF
jgi:hypothetical protein